MMRFADLYRKLETSSSRKTMRKPKKKKESKLQQGEPETKEKSEEQKQ